MDSLDSAIRKGKDVAYSPDNTRFKKMPAQPPPNAMPPDNDLEGSVRGGVPIRAQKQQPQPQSLLKTQRLARQQHQTPQSNTKSKEMKVAFTEFHNAPQFAQDSTSAYLGDEPSQHANDHFSALRHSAETDIASRYSESNISLALSPVAEDVVQIKTSRVLSPLLGTKTWSAGRRYLIAPAAAAMCPSHVLPVLSGNQKQAKHSDQPPCNNDPPSFPVFGSLILGAATVTHVGRSGKGEPYGWSSCVFVLRQNYLLEYEQESNMDDLPRGFAHLQHSVCHAHENFHDALHLQFYTSPCAKTGQRTVRVLVEVVTLLFSCV